MDVIDQLNHIWILTLDMKFPFFIFPFFESWISQQANRATDFCWIILLTDYHKSFQNQNSPVHERRHDFFLGEIFHMKLSISNISIVLKIQTNKCPPFEIRHRFQINHVFCDNMMVKTNLIFEQAITICNLQKPHFKLRNFDFWSSELSKL